MLIIGIFLISINSERVIMKWNTRSRNLCYVAIILVHIQGSASDSWDKWWSYSGISGPDAWGLLNTNWMMCERGRQQSPINIQPETLLFDPNLRKLALNLSNVYGHLVNTGNDITFYLYNDGYIINATDGPLSYTYTITDIKFHFGKGKYSQSEHFINNKSFPAELQFRGYNRDIYRSFEEAKTSVRGMIIIAVFIEMGDKQNDAFDVVLKKLRYIIKRGNMTSIDSFPVDKLFPNTDEYMTYEGSLTQPGCYESVTWIILNKPIYVTYKQMETFKKHAAVEWRKNNARPIQPLHQRVIRTNIKGNSKSSICNIETQYHYKVNENFTS